MATELVRSFHVGDTLKLEGEGEYVICEITYLHFYVSFEKTMKKEGLENMLPLVDSFADGIMIYNSFSGAKRVTDFGCCAIGVRCILSELNFELS